MSYRGPGGVTVSYGGPGGVTVRYSGPGGCYCELCRAWGVLL